MFSLTVALFTLQALIGASGAPAVLRRSLSPSYASLDSPRLSPYYVYFGNQNVTMADAFDSIGMRAVTLGFEIGNPGNCSIAPDLDILVDDAKTFVAKGGAINLSFGGHITNKTERAHLQQACEYPEDLASLIRSAMDKFGTHNIEFDIEDDSLMNDTASANRLGVALSSIRTALPDVHISYTMGTLISGMANEQQAYLQAAKDAGVQVDILNLMTMDMGLDNGTDIVQAAQSAMKAGAAQYGLIYNISSDDAMKHMGMLPAIGIDDQKRVLTIDGAKTLANFAKTNNMAMISYYSFNRDFPGNVNSSSSSIFASSAPDQTEDSQFFTTFKGALSNC